MKFHSTFLGFWLATALWLMNPAALTAETKHPAEQPTIKSLHSDVKTLLTFYNRSDQPIKIYWLDFDGNRVHYKTLQSLEGFAQITFLTHPWLVTDEDDHAWHLYYPDAQPRTIEIIAPPLE